MASVALTGHFANKLIPKSGSLSVVYIKAPYSTERKVNLAAYKRGTGGRSSFNGIVATVFGATGFVARSVVNKLGKIGTQMILPYRSDFYDAQRLKVAGDLGQVLFTPYDLRDEESIAKAVRHSNVVINLVGRDYETKNFKFNDVHVEGARRLARISRENGVERFIHLNYLNAEEKPKPLVLRKPSQFKISKFLGECAVREEFPTATIIRASDIYGSEDRFIRYFASQWRIHGSYLSLYKNGQETIKQPVFVSDVAQGIVNAARDPDTRCQVYQAVGPKRYKLADLVDWFYLLMRKDAKWGYRRVDMKYDPVIGIKVALINMLSPGYPFGNVTWEAIERNSSISNYKTHSCIPDLHKNEIDKQFYLMKEAASKTLTPIKAIYDEDVTPLKDAGLEIIKEIPTYNAVKSELFNKRKEGLQVKKLSYKSPMEVEIPPAFEPFMLADYACDDVRIIAFCSQEARKLIPTLTSFFGVGTFHSCPRPFQQLYTIHADIGSSTQFANVVPVIYVLMSDQKATSYEIMLNMVKSQIPGFNPQQFMTDYELAAMHAIRKTFPQAVIKGCFYHYARALWKQAQKLKVTKAQTQKIIVALATVLPFLPSYLIKDGWAYILNDMPDDDVGLAKFELYMERYWLKSDDFIAKWSIFGQIIRTTNCLEGWHSKINQLVGRRKPNLESTTDVVDPQMPSLLDLGVNLTEIENQAPWELKPFRAHLYYNDALGEFIKPDNPKVQC